MPGWQDDAPRPHHYRFGHRVLPSIMLNPTVDLLALAEAGRVADALRRTWTSVGEELAGDDRLPADGLDCALVEVAGRAGLLLTLPPAAHATEVHLALVHPLEPPDGRRYLTLEFSWDIATGRPSTVVGEWQEHKHVNWGGGPAPEPAAFLAAVEQGPLRHQP